MEDHDADLIIRVDIFPGLMQIHQNLGIERIFFLRAVQAHLRDMPFLFKIQAHGCLHSFAFLANFDFDHKPKIRPLLYPSPYCSRIQD